MNHYYMTVGTRTSDKNAWLLVDDGATISLSASYLVGALNLVNVAVDYAGSYYFATSDNAIYKYTSAMTLDTTWGTAGAYNVGTSIRGLAVDDSLCLAVGHDHSGFDIVTLLDADGAKLWSYGDTAVYSGYRVAFDSSGNIIFTRTSASGNPMGGKLQRSDGSLLQSYYTISGSSWIPGGLAVCSDDDVLIATGNAAFAEVRTRKCASDNTQQWLTTASSTNGTAACAAMDDSENLYVGMNIGTANRSIASVLYDGSAVTYYDTGNTVRAISYGPFGQLYAGGPTSQGAGESASANFRVLSADLVLLRYSNIGGELYAVADATPTAITTSGLPVYVNPQSDGAPGTTVTLSAIGLFSIGSPSGIDATHTATLTIKDASSNVVCTKTFNDVTVFPTDDYAELGSSLGYGIAVNAPVTVTVERHYDVSLPQYVIVATYTLADSLMCLGVRVLPMAAENGA